METATLTKPERPRAGWFRDRQGMRWFVTFNERGDARCNSEDNCYTAAFASTFKMWDWKREEDVLAEGGDRVLGLRQAAYILKSVANGDDQREVAAKAAEIVDGAADFFGDLLVKMGEDA